MKRRDFFKKSIGAGVVAGAGVAFGGIGRIFAGNNNPLPAKYDLAAIKGGEPDVMFDKAIEVMGGMKNYVKSGQTVVVKPNIGWDVIPEKAANTNPVLVKRIIEQCFDAGAKEVYVFDYTCDEWTRCYSNSGIEKAAKDAGAKVVPGNVEKYYREVDIPEGKNLKTDKVHELILDSDVFINVPILKSHGSAKLTICMKNLMGIAWGRKQWHRNDLHQCIADFATYCKPDLNVVDAYYVMKKNGPRGVSKEDVVTMKSLLISEDMVAADAAGAKLFGLEPDDVPYIKIADEMGAGTKDLDNLSISRQKL